MTLATTRLPAHRFWVCAKKTAYLCGFILAGCGSTQIIEKPVPVEVPGPVEWREIPQDLFVIHQKSTIPETLTWSEVAQLWTADRETIDLLNAQSIGN